LPSAFHQQECDRHIHFYQYHLNPLKGFKGAGVLEVVEDFDGDTYRAVYTVKLEAVVYVLHVFQKKSKQGIATPKQDINLIEMRLKRAQEHHAENYGKKRKGEKP
jgi:phage-related protein